MSNRFGNIRDAYKHFEKNSGSGANTGFFTLREDRDSTVVRFLHEGEEDLDWFITHQVEIDGKQRKVKCTEEGDCPLCVSGNRPQLRIFLQLVDRREPDKLLIWERGQNFIPIVLSFIQRYGTLCAQPVEVERLGKRGDTNTTYQLYPLEKDNKTLDDIDQKREQLASENGFILVKSQGVLEQIAQGTYVPDKGGGNSSNNAGNQSQQSTPKPRESKKSGSDIF